MRIKMNDFIVSQRTALTRIFVGGLFVLLIISSSYWEDEFVLEGFLFLLGALMVGVATVGRLWCSLYISGYKTKSLVTNGPYSMCRNPLYFFSLLGAVGVGFATETVVIPTIILLGFCLYYPIVMKEEEKELREIHKEKFLAYCKKTPRFFPKISICYDPEEYLVRPKIFKKCLFEVLWFVWILGILELAEALRKVGIIPNLFQLY
jgi:protein-S-isoprenylcysteine O-methyltransferase Ste14